MVNGERGRESVPAKPGAINSLLPDFHRKFIRPQRSLSNMCEV
jgi:hypothetical protein